MKIKEISITVGRTISLAPFETVRVEITQVAELDTGDDSAEVRDKLWKNTTKAVTAALENEKLKGYKEIEERMTSKKRIEKIMRS